MRPHERAISALSFIYLVGDSSAPGSLQAN